MEARETSAWFSSASKARGGAIIINVAGRGQRKGCVPLVSRWGVLPSRYHFNLSASVFTSVQ